MVIFPVLESWRLPGGKGVFEYRLKSWPVSPPEFLETANVAAA
jgi:hypothetical protein